jgi:hypothetical protein
MRQTTNTPTMITQAMSSEFTHYLSGYKGTRIERDGLSHVFAARDLVNNTIFELMRYAKGELEFQVFLFQHHETDLCEFTFSHNMTHSNFKPPVLNRINWFLQAIDAQFDFLNLQISEKRIEGMKLKLSTFHVGNGINIAMCEV